MKPSLAALRRVRSLSSDLFLQLRDVNVYSHVQYRVGNDLGIYRDHVCTLRQTEHDRVGGPKTNLMSYAQFCMKETHINVIPESRKNNPLVFLGRRLAAAANQFGVHCPAGPSFLGRQHYRSGKGKDEELTLDTSSNQYEPDGQEGDARDRVPSPLGSLANVPPCGSQGGEEASHDHSDIGHDGEEGVGG